MSEDIKNPENEDEQLKEELEELRDTFQQEYDKTVDELQNEPVIQELEDNTEDPDDEEDEDETADEEPERASRKAKKKKKRLSTGGKIAVVLGIVALVLILVLGSFMFITFKHPNVSRYFTAISAGDASTDYDEKLSMYEQAAASLTDEESGLEQSLKSIATDKIIELKYKEKGFTEAYTYIKGNMTDEEIAASSNTYVKKIKAVTESIGAVAESAFDKIFEGDASALTAEDVLKDLSVPTEAGEAVNAAVTAGLKGAADLKSASDFESSTLAANSLLNAYTSFTSLGADSEALAQKLIVKLYNAGYVYEALYAAKNLIVSDLAAPTEEYIAMQEEMKALTGFKDSVYLLAAQAVRNGAYAPEDCAKLVKAGGITEPQKAFLGKMISECASSIADLEARKLTSASEKCQAAMTMATAADMADSELSFYYIKTLFKTDPSSALSASSAYLTDETAAALSEASKAEYDEMQLAFDALNKTSEIFSTYYSSYYQSGTPIDFDAASKALDEYLTADSNRYDKGFVSYCKYFAKACSADKTDADKYLLECEEYIPEFLGMYEYNLVEFYLDKADYTSALATAEKMLAINVADDYSLYIKAFIQRTKKDVDGALKAALEGAELSGQTSYCTREIALDYILKGEYESAFGYLSKYYSAVLSSYYSTYADVRSACELLYMLNGLYKGDNADLKEDLAGLIEEVDGMYSQYSWTKLAETEAVIDGSKTPADLFLSGTFGFDFTAEE